jgi:cytochrome c553
MIGMNALAKPPPLMQAITFAALCAAFLGTTATLANDDAATKKAAVACGACHGPEGNKPVTPETPRLAGQQYGYLINALTEYRNGTRDNAVMNAMAKPLTDKEVADLASYFSRQQGLTTKR